MNNKLKQTLHSQSVPLPGWGESMSPLFSSVRMLHQVLPHASYDLHSSKWGCWESLRFNSILDSMDLWFHEQIQLLGNFESMNFPTIEPCVCFESHVFNHRTAALYWQIQTSLGLCQNNSKIPPSWASVTGFSNKFQWSLTTCRTIGPDLVVYKVGKFWVSTQHGQHEKLYKNKETSHLRITLQQITDCYQSVFCKQTKKCKLQLFPLSHEINWYQNAVITERQDFLISYLFFFVFCNFHTKIFKKKINSKIIFLWQTSMLIRLVFKMHPHTRHLCLWKTSQLFARAVLLWKEVHIKIRIKGSTGLSWMSLSHWPLMEICSPHQMRALNAASG